jgi:5-amino-6-(5-phosphoribosylamino)uracil reductase
MSARPYTVLSCAMSLDGYLDDASDERLVLSNAADLDRVDGQRAAADAILVGASTVRRDDPRLLVRDADRRAARSSLGLPASPTKVTVTRHGDLDLRSRMFDDDGAVKLVYCASAVERGTRRRLGSRATVIDAGPEPLLACVLADLADRGVERLLVEGGATILTQLLADGLADELHLVVAPFFVGDPGGTPFVRPAAFPWSKEQRARLLDITPVGDVALLRYALSERCAPAPASVPTLTFSLT